MGKTVIVIGAIGLVGRTLVDQLAPDKGVHHYLLVSSSTGIT